MMMPWITEVAPRLGFAGFSVASVTVDRMATQVVGTSDGRLPPVTTAHRLSIYRATIAKQTALTGLQFASTRELKLALDRAQPSPALSVMVACGLTGVPCSSLQYNWAIQDTYRFYGHAPPGGAPGLAGFLRQKVAPGLPWCFLRAGCGTGGGLHFGPTAAAGFAEAWRAARGPAAAPLPERAARLAGGLATGAAASLATQGVHNVTLVAGRMAALGERAQAPHYSTVALAAAWREMGPAVLYRNFAPRMVISASTVAVLNVCDIFRRPEISGASMMTRA